VKRRAVAKVRKRMNLGTAKVIQLEAPLVSFPASTREPGELEKNRKDRARNREEA
jgi:hypothetical protein